MYQEEYYQDKIDYQNDTSSISDYSSLDSEDRTNRKAHYELKKKDIGFYTTKKTIGYERVKIECYATDLFKNIRNASTGIMTNHRVGSKFQDLYFCVTDVSGEGTKIKFPKHLYYDSPEEYERHQFVRVSQDAKEKWYVKNLKARKTLFKN
jgi:hypothetical protein